MSIISKILKAAALACTIALSPAHAMDFSLLGSPTVVILKMDGEINLGDRDRLAAYLVGNDAWINNRPVAILISSPGGNLGETMRMIKEMKGSTVIVKDTCASACFFIFASAKQRAVGPNGRVGVHSVAIIPGHPEVNASEMTADMVRKLRELGVPDDICMDMLTTENSDIHWLTADQLARMHVIRP